MKTMVETTGDKKKYKLTHKLVDKTVDSPCSRFARMMKKKNFVLDVIEQNKNYKIGGL